MGQFLIPAHELGDAAGLGGVAHRHAVGLHYGAVVHLVGLAQFGRHGHLVVQVGEGAVRVQRAGIQNRLRRLFNLRPLHVGGVGPRKVVIY